MPTKPTLTTIDQLLIVAGRIIPLFQPWLLSSNLTEEKVVEEHKETAEEHQIATAACPN